MRGYLMLYPSARSESGIAPSNSSVEILQSYRVYALGFDCEAAITPRATPADTDADARAKCERMLHGLHARGRLTIIEQSRYQAILVLPGNGAASAMSWIFASGSTALIPHPMAEEVCACHVDVPRGHAPPNASRSSPLPLLFSSFRFGARH